MIYLLFTVCLFLSQYQTAESIFCYSCNSKWAACGNNPNLTVIQYSKELCPLGCKIWSANGSFLYRGCANETNLKNATSFTDANGITYNYCYSELCNVKYVPPPMFCYFCNSKWAACSNPPRLDLLQYSKVPCNGTCVSYFNPADNNNLYRDCLNSLPNDGTSGTYTSPSGVMYNYCSSNLCNNGDGARTTTKFTTISGNFLVTYDQLVKSVADIAYIANISGFAVNKSGYPTPSYEKYVNFVTQLESKGGIATKREAAMFLAQILWESDGLQATSEYACADTGCPGVYGTSQYPGKSYYGRGYMQLSWPYNYNAASQALYGDDRLLRDPDSVATNNEYAWSTAFWFWRANVGPNANVKNGHFGSSTMIINGGWECNGPYQWKAKLRYDIYKIVLKDFGVTETPIENGCYN